MPALCAVLKLWQIDCKPVNFQFGAFNSHSTFTQYVGNHSSSCIWLWATRRWWTSAAKGRCYYCPRQEWPKLVEGYLQGSGGNVSCTLCQVYIGRRFYQLMLKLLHYTVCTCMLDTSFTISVLWFIGHFGTIMLVHVYRISAHKCLVILVLCFCMMLLLLMQH